MVLCKSQIQEDAKSEKRYKYLKYYLEAKHLEKNVSSILTGCSPSLLITPEFENEGILELSRNL